MIQLFMRWPWQGVAPPVTPHEILVVPSYEAQVSKIAERILGARVGKFQGQEAPVLVYSMATSNAEEAPHGMQFLFNRPPPRRRERDASASWSATRACSNRGVERPSRCAWRTRSARTWRGPRLQAPSDAQGDDTEVV